MQFFNLTTPYHFEWNDVRCLITVVNVLLIMMFRLSISWLGLIIALLGVVKDLAIDRRINGLVMHLSNVVLNTYFLVIFYK